MNASIRIGVMAMMVLGIFSGVALADPPSGGDAGNSWNSANSITISPKYSAEWTIYQGSHYSGDTDWYKPNTVTNDRLWYQVDQQHYANGERLDVFDSNLYYLGSYGGGNPGSAVIPSSGTSYVELYNVNSISLNYLFALRVY